MPLSTATTRAIVPTLCQAFPADQVGSLLLAFDTLQAVMPSTEAASPNFGMYIPGMFYDAAYCGSTTTPSYAGIVNTLDLIPFFTTSDLRVDTFSIGVIIGAAGNARVLIYETAEGGLVPDRKVYESANLDTTTSTTAPVAADRFTFLAGKIYWIGTHTSAAPTLRGLRDNQVLTLGYATAASASTGLNLARRTVAFGSAPGAFNFTSADLVSALPPSVRFKVA